MEHRVTAPVDAPPEQVWQVLVDVERWPPLVESILEVHRVDSGPLRVGSEAIIKQPFLPRARWRVTELEPGRSFTWETTATGVTAVGGHAVGPQGQGSIITLTLRQHGPLAPLLHALLGRRSQRYIEMEIAGLARAAESPQG